MMKLKIYILLVAIMACSNQRVEEKRMEDVNLVSTDTDSTSLQTPIDSLNTDTISYITNDIDSVKHKWHEEDEDYPWYDTPRVGTWLQKEKLDALIAMLYTDTTRTLTSKLTQYRNCNSLPAFLYIEGCAKEPKFYLKNRGCNHHYFAVSNTGLSSKDTFLLDDEWNDLKYNLNFQQDYKLAINGIEYKDRELYNELNNYFRDKFEVYNSEGELLERMKYNSFFNTDSDIFAGITFHNLEYYLDRSDNRLADIISVDMFTGNMVQGEFEERKETIKYDFELIRTSNGFEFHDGYDKLNNKSMKGMCYKFIRTM